MKVSESRYNKCIYFISAAFARKVEKLAEESWKSVQLSPSLAYLLMLIIEEPGAQPSYIGRQLQLKPSTVTRLIEKLEDRKLVIRTTEGKITNVYPTPKGKDLLPELKSCLTHFVRRYETLLSKTESQTLVDTMSRLADKLDD